MASIGLFLFIITYFFIPCQSVTRNMLGPANLIYKSFELCETKERDIDAWITQRKYNRSTNVLDINLASPWPIDDDMEITSEVKKEGGYKPGSFHMKDKMCTVLSTLLGDMFSEFLRVAGTEDCPITEGKYEIKDFYFDNEKFNVPQLFGEYRTSVLIYKGTELKGCYFIFLDMVPKDE